MGTSPANSAAHMEGYVQRVKRSQAHENRLVKSKSVAHSAKELCDSPSSVGPSFVSTTERLFCDMGAKVLYPFCDDIEVGSCWEDDTDTVTLKGEVNEAKRALLPVTNFSNVVAWGSDE